MIGKPITAKAKVIAQDDENKSIVIEMIEGELMQLYTSFRSKITVAEGSLQWCLEFEKANELVPNPDDYVALVTEVTKGLDAYLCNY